MYIQDLNILFIIWKTDEERMKYRKDNFYEAMNCKTILGREATKVHHERKEVELDDDTVINYDKLLIATGSEPLSHLWKE